MRKKTIAFLLAAAMTAAGFAQNLIENSSFEDGVSQWKPLSWKRGDDKVWLIPAADTTTSQGAGGSTSMRLSWTNKTICYMWYHKEIPLPKVDEMQASFWLKTAGFTTSNQVELSIMFPEIKDKKKNYIFLRSPWNRNPEDWTCYSTTFKVPAGVTKAKLSIRTHGYTNVKGTNWIDNIYFGPVIKARAFVFRATSKTCFWQRLL